MGGPPTGPPPNEKTPLFLGKTQSVQPVRNQLPYRKIHNSGTAPINTNSGFPIPNIDLSPIKMELTCCLKWRKVICNLILFLIFCCALVPTGVGIDLQVNLPELMHIGLVVCEFFCYFSYFLSHLKKFLSPPFLSR